VGAATTNSGRSDATPRLRDSRADVGAVTVGGNLKSREMSRPFGDVSRSSIGLSARVEAVDEEGSQPADLDLVKWCMERASHYRGGALMKSWRLFRTSGSVDAGGMLLPFGACARAGHPMCEQD